MKGGGGFAAIDGAADRLFDRFRGRRVADTAAAALSNLGDYGFAWAVVAAVKGRRPGPARRRAVRALAVAGVTSYAVNATAKRAVGRDRPDDPSGAVAGTAVPVRRPTSSSFPSGHTLAAFCTATVLADTPKERAAYLAFAAAVAASRVHLRAHHATDVLGGAVIGTAAGIIVRPLVR
jgi:undecaprenyl-diphosphatase